MRFAYMTGVTLSALLLVVFVGALLFIHYVRRQRENSLSRFGNLELLAKISDTIILSKRRWKNILLVAALLLLVITLARPQMGASVAPIKRKGVDIVFAVDTSLSMLAEDLKPNRLEVAKGEIGNFIGLLKGDRVGLVAFAGSAFVQCPLTLDYQAAKMFLDVIDTEIIPVKGTALGEAIRKASEAFNQQEKKYKVLILLTDGEDHGAKPLPAAEAAAKEGIIIYTIGLGSENGEPIPEYDENGSKIGYKKDKQGEVVLTKLDVTTLQKIALMTGGKFYQALDNSLELNKIYEEISKLEKKELSSKLYTLYQDRYQYPLFLVILLLLIEYMLDERSKKKKAWGGRFE